MATRAKKKVHFPKTRLAELAARAGGLTRDDAVDGAMKSLESMTALANAEICKSIAAMEKIVFGSGATLDAAAMLAIQAYADQVVTLAGTFGHTTLDAAARSLCDMTDGLQRAGMHDRQPIAVHVQALHLMAPGAMSLSPEHCEKLLGELAKVAGHFSFGSLAAESSLDDVEIIAAAAK
ncbi:MAG: hypothetical protein WDN08_17445 [Rhizomicrobium sp.]